MTLTTKDHKYIWHPYTHQKNRPANIPIVKAKGVLLYDEKGNAYIDAISSWWVNIHGHSHPYIAKKIYQQAKRLEHVIFAGFTHEPAVKFAERIIEFLPGHFEKIFYSDNGSTAVEVALKMSLQYWQNKNINNRTKIIAFNNAYHGDTFGAMSTSARSIFTKAFDDKLFEVVFIDTPDKNNIEELKSTIYKIGNDTACFIYEPLIQGAGGMKMYEAIYLNQLLGYMKDQQILCIADEVMTGFFRTGKMFASDFCTIKPDIICMSKGITGGTMAMGVTACTEAIFNAFLSDDKTKTFYHGHSFTANPLACAAALASLDLIKKKNFEQSVENIIKQTEKFACILKETHQNLVKNVRVSGTIISFEIVNKEGDSYNNSIMQNFTPFCMESKVYLRSLGNTIYVMQPYCISKKQLKRVFDVILAFILLHHKPELQ